MISRGNGRASLFWEDSDRGGSWGWCRSYLNGFTLEFTRSCSWTTTVIRLHYVATRYGGYRLAELAGKIEGLKYQAAAQGVRRFRQGLAADPSRQQFVSRLRRRLTGPVPAGG